MTDAFPTRIAFHEARDLLAGVAAGARLGSETVPLSRAAGRILAEAVVAGVALPACTNSAMDGYAVRAADTASAAGLVLVGEQFAGRDLGLSIGPGQCLRITTGAPLPAGADAVLIKENARLDGDRVFPAAAVAAGTHVRHAGEDVAVGDTVLSPGQVLGPARLGLAAALGRADLVVARKPTVAIVTTGDELRPPGQPLQPGEVYDSNRVLLQALLQAEGYEPVAWPVVPDDPARLLSLLQDAAFSFDVVITCGGVSAGEKDHLPALLREHGRVHFWKVRMKPGMPLLCGQWGRAQVLALPGNPVSVLATFLALGRGLLDGLQGRAEPRPRWTARLSAPIAKRHERLEFLRGALGCDAKGQLGVAPNPADGSHRLRAAAEADCLLVLPEGAGQYDAGDLVEVLPYAAPAGGH